MQIFPARRLIRSYTPASEPTGTGSPNLGEIAVQTTQPRDVGALVFVVGLFVLLFLTTVLVPVH